MMLIKGVVSRSFASRRCFCSVVTPTSSVVLRAGDTLRRTRVFSNDDVLNYSKVSHDFNPLHLDKESARNAGYEGPLVHGMLVAALFPRIIASHFPGAVYVSQSLHFKAPVYIGEVVVGEVQAVNIRENKKRYIAKLSTKCFSTKCFTNGKNLVIDGEAMAILPTLTMEKVQAVD